MSLGIISTLLSISGADDRNRTGDLVLTKDALYRLSYVGKNKILQQAGDGNRTRDTWLGRPMLYQLSYSRIIRRGTDILLRHDTLEYIANALCSMENLQAAP